MSEGQRQIKRYGWKPSLPDHRDLLADTTGLTPLPEVDPRGEMPPVYDQGQLGSCTANAVGAALEYDGMLDGASPVTPSRLFIYYCERRLEGSTGSRPPAGSAPHPRPTGRTTSPSTPTTHPSRPGRTRPRTS